MDNNSNISNPFNFDSSVRSPQQEHLPSDNALDHLLGRADEQQPKEDPVHAFLNRITAEKDPFDLTSEAQVPATGVQQPDFQNFYQNAGRNYAQMDHFSPDVQPFKKEEPKAEEPKPEVKVVKEMEIQTMKEEKPEEEPQPEKQDL